MSDNEEEYSIEDLLSSILVNVKKDRGLCERLLGPIITEIENITQSGGNIAAIIESNTYSTAIKHIETMLKANEQLIKAAKVIQGFRPNVDEDEDEDISGDDLDNLYNKLESTRNGERR